MADTQLLSIKQTLQKGEDAVSALHQLNTLLDYSTRAETAKIAAFVSVQLLFDFLSSNNEELTEVCCTALEKIFKALEAQEICQYKGYIELGLQHPSEQVRQTCLDTLAALIGEPSIQQMLTTSTAFHLVTQTVGDQSLKCANMASNILFDMAANNKCKVDELAAELQGVMQKDSVVCCRVYELAVRIVVSNGNHISSLASILVGLVRELEGDDVLVQLNCIEMFILLMESPAGQQFLTDNQVVKLLHSMLSSEHDSLAVMLIPGILKFFGHMSCMNGADVESLCEQYPRFLSVVLEAIHHPEQDTTWGVAVDTFGVLGSLAVGRKALGKSGPQLEDALKEVGRLAREGRSEVRVRALHALGTVLSCPGDSQGSRRWLNLALLRPGATLLSIARQPFPDLHTEALGVIAGLAQSQWGREELKVVPGFIEYLLDRRTETEKAGKQLKYDIVHALVSSSTAEQEFGSSVLIKLRKYDREGAFFAGEAAVALQED